MEMIQVQSSNVEAIGYDADRSVLRVRFRSTPGVRQGGTYDYGGVTAEEYSAIMLAESKGRILRALVTSRPASRPYTRVD